jgi:hypothetical protein
MENNTPDEELEGESRLKILPEGNKTSSGAG